MKSPLLLVLAAALSAPAARAAPYDFYGEFLGPGMNAGARARLEERVYGSKFAAGQPFALEQTRFDGGFPVTNSPEVAWRGTVFTDFDAIQSGAYFPNGRVMPSQLWDPGAGISRTQNLDNGRALSASFTVSSPSDHPYSAGRDFGFNLHLSYKVPQDNGNAWIFFLSESNTRGYLNYVPVPGVAYYFHSGDTLRGLVGLPFIMLNWQPSDKWNALLFFFPIRNGELRLTYGKAGGLQAYSLVSFRTRNYALSDRSDVKERLFVEEGLAQAGLIIPIVKTVALDLGGGQSFARRYFLAEKDTDRTSAPAILPDNAPFVAVKVQAFF